MGYVNGRHLIFCLAVTLAFVIDGCAKSNSSVSKNSKDSVSADGGQDSGGGSVAYSTYDQVNSTLDTAINLAGERDASKNIVVQFWRSKGQNSESSSISVPKNIFPFNYSPVQIIENDPKMFESPALHALLLNRITRLRAGDCLNSKDQAHKDASVSQLSLKGEICFSIGNLMRIPPSALLREVLSLVIHEAAHLGGADEAVAVEWQNEFSSYFGARFGDISRDTVTDKSLETLAEAQILLARAQDMAKSNPGNPKIFEVVGRFRSEVESLPDFQDPLALQLKVNPPHPTLIDNYSKAVFVLLQNIEDQFENPPEILRANGVIHVPIDINYATPDKIPGILSSFDADLARINENFLAFSKFDTTAQSKCVAPKSDTTRYGRTTFSLKTFGLKRECEGGDSTQSQTNLY